MLLKTEMRPLLHHRFQSAASCVQTHQGSPLCDQVSVEGEGEDFTGLIKLDMSQASPLHPAKVVKLAALLIKGALTPDEGTSTGHADNAPQGTPLEVVDVRGGLPLLGGLVRDVCIPALVLRCAQLRVVSPESSLCRPHNGNHCWKLNVDWTQYFCIGSRHILLLHCSTLVILRVMQYVNCKGPPPHNNMPNPKPFA